MFFRQAKLKNALIVLKLQKGLTTEARQYVDRELDELGITIHNDNIYNAISDIMVRSKLLGDIFAINSSDVYIYHNRLWPLYKAIIKIANDATHLDTVKLANKILKRNELFDEHMKDFDTEAFKVTSKIAT